MGVGRRRNTAAKGRRRRPELTRLVTRESALQAAGRASAKARRWACEVGSAECKGRRGVSEGTDGSSSRQAPCRTSGADSELPRTTTTTSRAWVWGSQWYHESETGLRAAVPAQPHGGDGEPAKGPQVWDPALTLSSPRLLSLPPPLPLLNQFPRRLFTWASS